MLEKDPKLAAFLSHPELADLLELLARKAHESWAERLVDRGWSFATVRDDAARVHPCLVPFDDLPEAEREADRVVVRGVVSAILALGYRIVPAERLE